MIPCQGIVKKFDMKQFVYFCGVLQLQGSVVSFSVHYVEILYLYHYDYSNLKCYGVQQQYKLLVSVNLDLGYFRVNCCAPLKCYRKGQLCKEFTRGNYHIDALLNKRLSQQCYLWQIQEFFFSHNEAKPIIYMQLLLYTLVIASSC